MANAGEKHEQNVVTAWARVATSIVTTIIRD